MGVHPSVDAFLEAAFDGFDLVETVGFPAQIADIKLPLVCVHNNFAEENGEKPSGVREHTGGKNDPEKEAASEFAV
ncbi:MAG: hypothetical protein E7651_04325 [Ruminococcaceae bacterium]|nr:hypothetical protein [Oscillospiraceae bacterium]